MTQDENLTFSELQNEVKFSISNLSANQDPKRNAFMSGVTQTYWRPDSKTSGSQITLAPEMILPLFSNLTPSERLVQECIIASVVSFEDCLTRTKLMVHSYCTRQW